MMMMMMMGRSNSTLGSLFLLAVIVVGICSAGAPIRSRVRRQNMKVRINATGDTIIMKFLRPNADTKLEGYILGYGGSMFSKQFIQLPENGQPYETEMDAEPKYLIAVQPIPLNDVKKQCTGKVQVEKPLHLVIGSVTPTSVLLSWGTLLKTPYEGNIMNDCLEEGHYTVRYRERHRKWNYQTCPTSDTVIDNLKPNTAYEFGVQPNGPDRPGTWSKPVIHNTNIGDKPIQKPYKPRQVKPTQKPFAGGPRAFPFPPRPVLHNRTQGRLPVPRKLGPKATLAPTHATRQNSLSNPGTTNPLLKLLMGTGFKKPSTGAVPRTTTTTTSTTTTTTSAPTTTSTTTFTTTTTAATTTKSPTTRVTPAARNTGQSRGRVAANPASPLDPRRPTRVSNSTHRFNVPGASGERHKGHAIPKPLLWPRDKLGSPPILHPSLPVSKRPNLVGKPSDHHDKPMDLKQGEKESILKHFPLVTAKPKQERKTTTTSSPASNVTRFDISENSTIFRSQPASDVDAMGKKRFVAPHVVYKTDKKPDEPCSITNSLTFFPDEEAGEQNATAAPRLPPTNLTVVTVEGCPSFVILDWEKSDNATREYKVISTTKGPHGEEVSILTTNQTHTAVENLKPESSYEFTVLPNNEHGSGPPSEPLRFETESADPRVSENVSGKDAIWTQFPFKADAYSECNGKQYVKRTWYRKFVGIQLCNSLRYKIYLSDSLNGKFYNIGDQTGHGEDHCQFVDSFLDGRTGSQLMADQLPSKSGFYRAMRQEPVHFGEIGGNSHSTYVGWYECGTPIPGKW
ncbi:target of Nesh-SH3 isoform X1 [Gadus chalcogrammus]|uniref:target of Nesh-SH3 isoform X1 n=1 Tax=Gadus chalcogrammus TaxID=1042646 RepID=UPI0024C4ACCB|nr:target of Nesh-SH3 isoform X1 [Gadus chalcogrammus]